MSKAVRREGPCAPLFYSAVVLLSASLATAQSVERSDLELCASLESAELKLACFEAIIAASKLAESAAKTEPPAPDAQDEIEPAAGPKPVEPDAQVLPATTSAVTAATAAAVQETVPAQAVPQDDFGSEYLDKPAEEEEQDEVYYATVTEVRRGYANILSFYFDNGHVWRQMEYTPLAYPRDRPFDVEITRGWMGDYQLRVEGKGRMTRIVRVK